MIPSTCCLAHRFLFPLSLHHPQLHQNSSPSLSPSLPPSPSLSLSLSPHHNHRVSVFLRGSSGLDKLHYLHFDVFLSPPSLRPSVLGLLLSALLLRALLLFFMYFISFLVFFALVAVARHPSLLQSLTLTRSFAQVQSHFGKILHMSKSSRVKPFVFHLRENEPKNVMNI